MVVFDLSRSSIYCNYNPVNLVRWFAYRTRLRQVIAYIVRLVLTGERLDYYGMIMLTLYGVLAMLLTIASLPSQTTVIHPSDHSMARIMGSN